MNKEVLIEEACQELLTYGVWDGKIRIKYLIRKYLMRQKMAPEDLVFWPTGLLAAGLWQYRQEMMRKESKSGKIEKPGAAESEFRKKEGDEASGSGLEKNGELRTIGSGFGETMRPESAEHELKDSEMPEEGVNEKATGLGTGNTGTMKPDAAVIDLVLEAYYERWIQKGCPIMWLDDLLAGETLLNMDQAYRQNGQESGVTSAKSAEKYRQAIEKLAAFGLAYPTDETGSFPYRAEQENGFVFADSIGLACPFLYRYGVVYERKETMELAVKQIVNFLAYGMDIATGLPYHGYSITDDCKYGIIGWGRAVGWLMRGMAGCMTTEYGVERLGDSYIKLVDAAISFQRKDGYFSWQLQAVEGPADTSATGMICAALKQGIELGILKDEKYEQALQAGRSAVMKSVRNGRVYDCSGECEGFGQYPQRYGAYPWALGAALML